MSLEAALENANASIRGVVEALGSAERVDVASLPTGALDWAIAECAAAHPERRFIVVTANLDEAYRHESNLRFLLGDENGEVLLFTAADTSPLLDVVPDRRAEMQRMAVLARLAEQQPWRALVVPAAAFVRRVPPMKDVQSGVLSIEIAEQIERDQLVQRLLELGYLRVPLVEDRGTFSARGALVDVYGPDAALPVRIELDDDLVTRIRHFNPDDQKTADETDAVQLASAREVPDTPAAIARAKNVVRELCDEMNMPTLRARELIAELDRGSGALISNALLPAYFEALDTLFDYIPQDARMVLADPTAIAEAVRDEQHHATDEHSARRDRPTFELSAYYMTEDELCERLQSYAPVVAHRLAVHGAASEDEGPIVAAFAPPGEATLRIDASDQRALISELRAHKAHGDRGLQPLADRLQEWTEQGVRVSLVGRTQHQADRLIDLLRSYGVADRVLDDVRLGELRDGFVLWSEGIAYVTEEEIFGARVRQRRGKRQTRRQQQRFLEDLRELSLGDFVVHADHGVGKYLGLRHKALSLTAMDRLHGRTAQTVEVMVVEYAGGDKLFLPVTRLGVIQKFKGGEGHQPKLDRLGGTTFATKKGRVRKAVQQMAEELLKLYAERSAARREPIEAAGAAYAEFEATFPFEETRDQEKAIDDVMADLEEPQPTDRLVCGDVGFGKTEVALRAAFRVAMSGRQVGLLCPTTVLAQQHYRTFSSRLDGYPLRVEVLSRFVSRTKQIEVLSGLKDGTVDVVIGTHRLLSKDVHFANLGLLVVDEEQRFGVTHKERIKKLRTNVDVVTLSATPIPRTLQLAVGGMRKLSLITTAPQDRRAVRTFVCRWDEHLIKEAIERELSRGGQVFFVYNRIEGLYERAQRLQDLLPNARIAVAHGRMKPALLDKTMTDFVEGAYDVLCSTAIVESGLDIPRANTILVDRADALGLGQLYQLRGRVGRSDQRAYCYLITPPPHQMSEESRVRMEALERFSGLGAGFRVATLDMELRGAGNLLGSEQSGNASLVGFDMFVQMLDEAVSELKGEHVQQEVDPELSIELEHYLPEDYVDDIGLRLSLYRRFATAVDEQAVEDLAAEMEERFGPPPPPARDFVRVMSLKPLLRDLRALGCEADVKRVTLHLREDTPLDPARLMPLVATPGAGWGLSPDMKLTRRYRDEESGDAVDRVRSLLRELEALRAKGEEPPKDSSNDVTSR
ncbi:MAG: transcription-repair coupling factor [Deltaproteobacteria bacterium]|nr:transcription-repair coupling factor [Deltaproteobacteria bacterium]MBW2549578.1 transcription-repair coupling factor [Deltaproteobacteria bacterium]MBW2627213.1 transcription-repair coupling factor [Deltaproteobacteria bacterium]MBW2684481.1 transcription-repair coupling factor [Deltaproteobacteria bacterium]